MGGCGFKVMTESVATSPLNLTVMSISSVSGARPAVDQMCCLCRLIDTEKEEKYRDREQRRRRKGLYHVLPPKLTHQIAPFYPLKTNESGVTGAFL